MDNFLKIWVKLIVVISIVLSLVLIANWNDYSWIARLSFMGFALIGYHALEEEKYPGGFMYMINVVSYKSELPDRFPLNTHVAMLVDMSVMAVFTIMFFVTKGAPWFGLTIALFCVVEVLAHTLMGIGILKKLRSRGKRTIFNPGIVTAYLGFLPIGIALLVLVVPVLTWTDWVIGIAAIAVVIVVFIRGIESKFSDKNTKYVLSRKESYGYFLKYLNESDFTNENKNVQSVQEQ